MNKRKVAVFTASIIASLAIGIVIGSYAAMPGMFSGKSIDKFAAYPFEINAPGSHTHNQKEVPAGIKAPSISMEIFSDPMKERNYSLHIITKNFRFAPESVSMKPVFGEGHAHLYIDDVLISRIYGPWQHIPALKPGAHKIYVTLNLNNHDEYMVNGYTIGARTTIEAK